MPPTNPNPLSDRQTAELLRRGMTVPVRPIDSLLGCLGTPGGWTWLEALVRAEFSEQQMSIVHDGGANADASASQLIKIKEIAKTGVAEAATEERALAAMAVYCLAVASGLVHHGQLYSSRPVEEWSELFADLAGVASPHWRGMLFKAAEIALLRSQA